MSFTLCTSGAIIIKAGANASSVAIASGTILEQFSNETEALINCESRYDWVANYAGLQANDKVILSDIASSIAANKVINYDMSGYTSRSEAETMLDFNRDIAQQGISLIKDQKVATFIKTG